MTSRALILATAACLAASPAPDALASPSPTGDVVAGTAEEYRPVFAYDAGGTLLVPSAVLAGRVETVTPFTIDRERTEFDPGTHLDLLARVGLFFTSFETLEPFYVSAELELDAFTGLVTPGPGLEGDGLPNSQGSDFAVLRAANATVSYRGMVALRGGFMLSDWGLGLVANHGARWWTPGSADFTDPRGGDRVLRGQLLVRSPGLDFISGSVAIDKVIDDETLRPGDDAIQAVAAVYAERGDTRGGLYAVARFQDTADDREIEAYVVDLFAETTLSLGERLRLTLATEWALIWGRTTLAPTVDHREQDILQLGGVVHARLDAGNVGAVLDLFFASGDRNFDDGRQNAFRADPNFSMGMFLFPYLMAAQSGRATHTAAPLDIIGYPPDDLDRFPSRGSATNTFAIFPRFWIRPAAGLELYGGPLFAFANVEPADPFNTRLAGGTPRNALDARPGTYLGTELDLGIRYRMLLFGSELILGLEGGVFLPGDALEGVAGDGPGAIAGGRFMMTYRL